MRKFKVTEIPTVGAYQVSDTVPDGLIEEVVKDCPDIEGCTLSCHYLGGTLMGISKWYDATGKLHVRDENHQSFEVTCKECWKSWKVECQ